MLQLSLEQLTSSRMECSLYCFLDWHRFQDDTVSTSLTLQMVHCVLQDMADTALGPSRFETNQAGTEYTIYFQAQWRMCLVHSLYTCLRLLHTGQEDTGH